MDIFKFMVVMPCSLKKRIEEHKGDIRMNRESSASALHAVSTNHKINFKNVHILDTVNFKKQRDCVEMLNIHYYPNTLNRMEDTLFLRNSYK